jgi:hypothetical protein
LLARSTSTFGWNCFSQQNGCRSPEGRSIQFAVDEHPFLLRQTSAGITLSHSVDGQEVDLAALADDTEFQDRLLVAIDDALQSSS